MVAAKGMLSTKAEAMAESQMMTTIIMARLPPVRAPTPWAMASSTPDSSRPLTARNRPMKKRIVCQSTRLIRWAGDLLVTRVRTAARTPTVEMVRPVLAWVISRTTMTAKITTATANFFQSLTAFRGSSSSSSRTKASRWDSSFRKQK